MKRKAFLFALIAFVCINAVEVRAQYQDTVKVGLVEFIQLVLDNSAQTDYNRTEVSLAENRLDQVRAQRYLPVLNYRSNHGLAPGVKAFGGLPQEEWYLDPTARNDWENFGMFTAIRVQAAQPLFTWGAVTKAVQAAEMGIQASEQQFQAKQNELELRLFDLYYSYVLAREIEALILEANDKIDEIGKSLNDALEDGDEDIDDSDLYKFDIFKSEFQIQQAEVQQSLNFIRDSWQYLLRSEGNTLYIPETEFLQTVGTGLETAETYKSYALRNRPELKGLDFGRQALDKYISSLRAQNLPQVILGAETNLRSTPIRPRQRNAFIINRGNTFNTNLSITIRQNLNFFSIKPSIDRSRIEMRRVGLMKEAASDGIVLEVGEAYRNASLSEVKVVRTDEALVKTKEWLRQEQLDYDFGLGNSRDLVDALKKELELKFNLKEYVFEYNTNYAKLLRAAGFSVQSLGQ